MTCAKISQFPVFALVVLTLVGGCSSSPGEDATPVDNPDTAVEETGSTHMGDADPFDGFTVSDIGDAPPEADVATDVNTDAADAPDTAECHFLFFPDEDLDGYGNPAGAITACEPPEGYVIDSTDCDDTDFDVNTEGVEACDGIDNNCDGTVDEVGCPCPVEMNDGRAYLFCDEAMTWPDARDACEAVGYHLVALETDAENTWVRERSLALGQPGVWHGLNDRATEDQWQWPDGTLADYVNWDTGEPNDYQTGEDCGSWSQGETRWNDLTCTNTRDFICESP